MIAPARIGLSSGWWKQIHLQVTVEGGHPDLASAYRCQANTQQRGSRHGE
jgi:hypothetical protein